jgi:hypothetical protein
MKDLNENLLFEKYFNFFFLKIKINYLGFTTKKSDN